MNLTIIDDAISKGYQNIIENDLCSPYSSWYYNEHITDKNPQSKDTNSGFSHIIFAKTKKSEYYALVYPILLEALDKYNKGTLVKKLFRIRASMFLKDQTPELYNLPHTDLPIDHYTMLYYVMDSDGPTRIFSNGKIVEEIEPKKGRVVFFSGDTYHASASPRHHARRMVINYNFLL